MIDAAVDALVDLLCCPSDQGQLRRAPGRLVCGVCDRRYVWDGQLVSFLSDDDLAGVDRSEQVSRDTEAAWYDTIFAEYTNVVEVPATLSRLGRPTGPLLDHGAGTGRITATMVGDLGQPVIALDYSMEALRLLLPRVRGKAVLVVHGDGRQLPIRSGVLAGITSAEVYEHFRAPDRRRVLEELARVLQPGAPLSISSLNFNLTFRLWKLKGNKGAKEGEHMFGGDFYYLRQTAKEFRSELAAVFTVEELVGIRNIPARSLSVLVARVAGRPRGDRFLDFMTRRGQRLDRALETTPLSRQLGFFLLAKVTKR